MSVAFFYQVAEDRDTGCGSSSLPDLPASPSRGEITDNQADLYTDGMESSEGSVYTANSILLSNKTFCTQYLYSTSKTNSRPTPLGKKSFCLQYSYNTGIANDLVILHVIDLFTTQHKHGI